MFKLDLQSGLPIYLQLVEQVKLAIASGVLKTEDKMPSVRQLAMDLRVNPNTISKAYNIMETEKILYTKRGEGTFVISSHENNRWELKEYILLTQIDSLIIFARQLFIDKETLIGLIKMHSVNSIGYRPRVTRNLFQGLFGSLIMGKQ